MYKKYKGYFYAFFSFFIWGILPLYWKLLQYVDPLIIISFRITWAFVFFFFVLIIQKRVHNIFIILKDRKKLFSLILTSLLIGGNWFVYIWAVMHNKVVEASMGYYINPLLSIMLGALILKEKLHKLNIISFLLAVIGVFIIIWNYNKIPWIAIILSLMFAFYGLLKKVFHIETIPALTIETGFLLPISFFFVIYYQFDYEVINLILLIFGGFLTALPLFLFVSATKYIELHRIGFTQYISPTLNLIIAIFIFHEQFNFYYFISFLFIWIGLLLFSISVINQYKKIKKS